MDRLHQLLIVCLLTGGLTIPVRAQPETAKVWSCDELRVMVENAVGDRHRPPYRNFCNALAGFGDRAAGKCGKMAFAYYESLAAEQGNCSASGLVQAQLSDIHGEEAFAFGEKYYFDDVSQWETGSDRLRPVADGDRQETALAWYRNAANADGRFALAFEQQKAKRFREAVGLYERAESSKGLGKYSNFMIGRLYLRGNFDLPRSEDEALAQFSKGGRDYNECWSAYMHGALIAQGTARSLPDKRLAMSILNWILDRSECGDSELRRVVKVDIAKLQSVTGSPGDRSKFVATCLNNTVSRVRGRKIKVTCQ